MLARAQRLQRVEQAGNDLSGPAPDPADQLQHVLACPIARRQAGNRRFDRAALPTQEPQPGVLAPMAQPFQQRPPAEAPDGPAAEAFLQPFDLHGQGTEPVGQGLPFVGVAEQTPTALVQVAQPAGHGVERGPVGVARPGEQRIHRLGEVEDAGSSRMSGTPGRKAPRTSPAMSRKGRAASALSSSGVTPSQARRHDERKGAPPPSETPCGGGTWCDVAPSRVTRPKGHRCGCGGPSKSHVDRRPRTLPAPARHQWP